MMTPEEQQPHILVVDDHRDIREPLASYLRKYGLRASVAADAASARMALAKSAFSLIVLDVMMPGEDGISLCRYIREAHDLPVILLTAMSEETDRVVGLEVGADDYVTKPFSPRELLARIRNVLRRTNSLPRRHQNPSIRAYRFERWTLDLRQRELSAEGVAAVSLSTAEYRLLLAFLQRPGVVLTRDQLLDITAGRDATVFDRSIDNNISRLRRKVEDDPSNPRVIRTVWGSGYQLASSVLEITA